jgi:hypothetical protein
MSAVIATNGDFDEAFKKLRQLLKASLDVVINSFSQVEFSNFELR